jgi:hypothetical protein
MDYKNQDLFESNNNNTDNNDANTNRTSGAGMATASMVLGILSLATLLCIYPSFILGGLGIALALLSRGREKKLLAHAKTAIILSCIGITSTLVMIIVSITMIFSNPELFKMYESMYEQMTGDSFEDEIDDYLPKDLIPLPEETPSDTQTPTDI